MGARGEERAARSIFRFERARTGLENFGCERGLGLSTHWQWSVMVTGGRASEQSSNRAIEQPSTRAQPVHPSDARFGPSPGIIPCTLRTRTYITRARNMYDVLFLRIAISRATATARLHDLLSSPSPERGKFFLLG